VTGTLALALAIALFSAIAQALASWFGRLARSRRAQVRAARAGAGEREAAGLLEQAGFAVVAAQVSASYDVEVDGARVAVPLRVDYLVRRKGRRYIAEVKTGDVAPRIGTAATRRQLLEYLVAFDVDGVLLVDGERGTVHDVRFGLESFRSPRAGAAGEAPRSVGKLRAAAKVGFGVAAGVLAGALGSEALRDDGNDGAGERAQAAARAASSAGAAFGPMPASTQRRATSNATGLTRATRP
jgi:hypothetical protein